MTPEERDRLAHLEAHYDALRDDMREMRDDVKKLLAKAENIKGGWWTVTVIGGIGATIGGLLMKVLPMTGKG